MRFKREAVRMEAMIGSGMRYVGVLPSLPNTLERENWNADTSLRAGLFNNLNHPSGIQGIFLK